MTDLELCDWAMPADAKLYPEVPCILEPGHDGQHVIAYCDVGCASFYGVEAEARTLTLLAHADLRSRQRFTLEEAAATWALLEASRSRV